MAIIIRSVPMLLYMYIISDTLSLFIQLSIIFPPQPRQLLAFPFPSPYGYPHP